MPAPPEILDLVARFELHHEAYDRGQYNETQLRRDFLDPFFKALGWDMDNTAGYAEAYRDVLHEDIVHVGGVAKSPDYSFGIGKERKFFVEAKKPSVNIKEDLSPALQIRSYAWCAGLSLSILSDFEEFAVYDGRYQAVKDDPASTARVFYCTFREYAEKWDWIASIFSREAILKGSFDKYVADNKAKRGTATFDEAFLATLEDWRKLLAENIALRNPALSQREVNFAVQRILDRIIFLRIAEDRGVEFYGKLKSLIGAVKDQPAAGDPMVVEEPPGVYGTPRRMAIYPRLCEYFERADARYNSGLFHFTKEKDREEAPDTLTLGLQVDDSVLKEILKHLYYPDSTYTFNVVPTEILGHIYEQFLGKVIRLTEGHRAKIEEKPEVRKAGGVYYTPSYIVDYIVQQTVGPLVEGKNPDKVEKIRILDPACGSGSFLLGAFQFLLDWHLRYYLEHNPAKWAKGKAPRVFETAPNAHGPGRGSGNWRLTTAERKRILLNNIYGVDIDSQAVEVTKLSLLLKILEGEAREYRGQVDFHRVLPDLGKNIKCGNSLIGFDFDQQGELNLMNEEESLKINLFDWDGKDGFPEIIKSGGFDAVIGNPPYLGGREWKEENGNQYAYFIDHYQVAEYQFDIYALFIEKGLQLANKGGRVGLITPNTWLNNQSNTKLRKFLLSASSVESVVDYSKVKVFKDATVLPIITILHKGRKSDQAVQVYKPKDKTLVLAHSIKQALWHDDGLCIFNIDLSPEDAALRKKIEMAGQPLEKFSDVRFGIKIYETGKGEPPQRASDAENQVFEATRKIDASYRRYLEGKDIESYRTKWQGRWLKYGRNLAAPRDSELFLGERLVFRRIVGERLIGTLLDADYVTSQLLQIVKPTGKLCARYLLGILNSKLMAFFFRKKYNRQDITFPEIRIYELASLPILVPEPTQKTSIAHHDKIVALAARILSLHQKLANVKTPHEQTALERQISATELQIDRLVYDLYGLTKEEIAIVEK